MFKNLNQRERILTLAVLGLVPILLLFWALTSFSNRYFANNRAIAAVRAKIVEQEDLQYAAQLAQQRRHFYRDHGLPADHNMAPIQYGDWLNDLLKKHTGMGYESLQEQTPIRVPFLDDKGIVTDVYRQYSWKFVAKGNLEQLLKFLRGFRSLDMMHRISSMNIKPQTVKASGSEKIVLTDELRIECEVQVLSMVDAELQRDFSSDVLLEPEAVSASAKSILVRNIFGPANNPPRITSSSSKSAVEESAIGFDITADDPDGDENLKLEMFESEIEGAELVMSESSGKAMFNAPPQAAGKYSFKVRVADSGFPPKSSEKSFTITVAEKTTDTKVPEPPPFKHAKATRLTAITVGIDGRLVCWVDVLTINEHFEPAVGETFELDDLVWTVRAISKKDNTAIFEVENKLLTIALGSSFDKPVSTESIAAESLTKETVEKTN